MVERMIYLGVLAIINALFVLFAPHPLLQALNAAVLVWVLFDLFQTARRAQSREASTAPVDR